MRSRQPGGFSAVRAFFVGVSFLFRGFRVWVTAPRLMLLGLLPAAIVGLVAFALIVALVVAIDPIAAFLTPFSDQWDEVPRVAVRVAAGAAVLVASILILINTFTTVTLMVGDSFYRRIARHVEEATAQAGQSPSDDGMTHAVSAAPQSQESFWKSTGRALSEGLRMLLATVGVALLVFALGFIPLVGTVVAATAGAVFGGWLLVLELTNIPFEARGLYLGARRSALTRSRAVALGFGTATYLVFLLPFGAVLAMPSAVAGATLLTRSLLRQDAVARDHFYAGEKDQKPPAG